MSKILVFSEFQNGQIKRSSAELIQFAKNSGGTSVIAFCVGSQATELAQQAAHNGATEVLTLGSTDFNFYNPELYASALVEAVKKTGVTVILGSTTSTAKDLFPRVSALLEAGLVSDGIEIQISGEDLKIKKPLYAGKCFATAVFENTKIKMVLMRANQLPVVAADTSKTSPQSELVFFKNQL